VAKITPASRAVIGNTTISDILIIISSNSKIY
jgi:hypothetical protein